MTCSDPGRSILLASYFWRSLELEGIGVLAGALAKALTAEGWEVTLLLPEGKYEPIENVRIYTYEPSITGIRRYCKAVREHSRHVEAVLLMENNPAMAWARRWTHNPRSTFCFFYSPLQGPGVLKEMGLCKQGLIHAVGKSPLLAVAGDWPSRRCIVGSDYQARQLRALGVVDVHVIPTCSILQSAIVPSRSEARKMLGWDDATVIGYMGHFSRAKGVDVLVDAFAACNEGAHLALAHSGKGQLRKRNLRVLEDLRLTGRLRELGVVESTSFLAACDAVVLPYITASIFHQPQVLLESFAARTPVITSDVGGLGELVIPSQTGLLVAPRDPEALRKAIEQVIANRTAFGKMGLNARAMFENSLSLDRFISKLSLLYRTGKDS